MNVEIGAEAALFPEKEYISGIFVAVQSDPTQVLLFLNMSPYTLHAVFLPMQLNHVDYWFF
jgi:hypothetical protein